MNRAEMDWCPYCGIPFTTPAWWTLSKLTFHKTGRCIVDENEPATMPRGWMVNYIDQVSSSFGSPVGLLSVHTPSLRQWLLKERIRLKSQKDYINIDRTVNWPEV